MDIKKLPSYEMKIDDNDESGVFRVSFVDSPAIEVDFIALNAQKEIKLQVSNEEKQWVSGPVLIPDHLIYREHKGQGYTIYFTKEEIEKIAKKFFRLGYTHSTNEQHSIPLDGNYVIESWFVSAENDKSKDYGYELPEGTWFMTYHIQDKSYFDNKVKSEKVKGFSIEGLFDHVPAELMKQEKLEKVISDEGTQFFIDEDSKQVFLINGDGTFIPLTNDFIITSLNHKYIVSKGILVNKLVIKMKSMLEKILNLFKKKLNLAEFTIEDGRMIMVDESTGEVYFIDENGSLLDQVIDAELTTSDGKIVVVRDGLFVEIKDAETAEPAEDELPNPPAAPEEEAPVEDEAPAEEEIPADVESYTTADGVIIMIDRATGSASIEGSEEVVNGEFTLEDGRILVIVDGVFVEIKDAVSADAQLISELQEKIKELEAKLAEKETEIQTLSKQPAEEPKIYSRGEILDRYAVNSDDKKNKIEEISKILRKK